MFKSKTYFHKKSCLEALIAEGCLVEECMPV